MRRKKDYLLGAVKVPPAIFPQLRERFGEGGAYTLLNAMARYGLAGKEPKKMGAREKEYFNAVLRPIVTKQIITRLKTRGGGR